MFHLNAYSGSAIWMPSDGYGLSLVYTTTSGRKMNVTIEDNDKIDSRTAKAVAICETARSLTETSLKLEQVKQVA